jgi:hypothetical protein
MQARREGQPEIHEKTSPGRQILELYFEEGFGGVTICRALR